MCVDCMNMCVIYINKNIYIYNYKRRDHELERGWLVIHEKRVYSHMKSINKNVKIKSYILPIYDGTQ